VSLKHGGKGECKTTMVKGVVIIGSGVSIRSVRVKDAGSRYREEFHVVFGRRRDDEEVLRGAGFSAALSFSEETAFLVLQVSFGLIEEQYLSAVFTGHP